MNRELLWGEGTREKRALNRLSAALRERPLDRGRLRDVALYVEAADGLDDLARALRAYLDTRDSEDMGLVRLRRCWENLAAAYEAAAERLGVRESLEPAGLPVARIGE